MVLLLSSLFLVFAQLSRPLSCIRFPKCPLMHNAPTHTHAGTRARAHTHTAHTLHTHTHTHIDTRVRTHARVHARTPAHAHTANRFFPFFFFFWLSTLQPWLAPAHQTGSQAATHPELPRTTHWRIAMTGVKQRRRKSGAGTPYRWHAGLVISKQHTRGMRRY